MPSDPADCPHPYFTEIGVAIFMLALAVGVLLMCIGAAAWQSPRARRPLAIGAATAAAAFASLCGNIWLDWLIMRLSFGQDWARLQHEIHLREADLDRYAREHADESLHDIVQGFLATNDRPNGFDLADPNIPPLYFKVSDWRDTVPRIVVDFGCGNNVLFNSATMFIESSD